MVKSKMLFIKMIAVWHLKELMKMDHKRANYLDQITPQYLTIILKPKYSLLVQFQKREFVYRFPQKQIYYGAKPVFRRLFLKEILKIKIWKNIKSICSSDPSI